MPAYDWAVNAVRPRAYLISAGFRSAAVPARGNPRDYGFDLARYFDDDRVEPVNFRAQRSPDS
ncbi:hypothetical protein DM39_1233 [Burkholderia cenocepacia]|uniref:Uncharacterized protein n=1 Tax=Burkholderia cenocepacia TaxID=95486 RepID=A0AAN0VNQ6_9BURK|nr:hypothetical protein DM39_1233 [Burkholderia cenocepacia]